MYYKTSLWYINHLILQTDSSSLIHHWCIIHCSNNSNSNAPLVNLKSMDTWKVIVEAAKKQSYAPVLELPESKSSSNESDGLPPDICYHRQCYQIFATKNLLKRIKKKSEDPTADEKTNQEELRSLIDHSQSYLTGTVMLRSSSTCSSAGSSILPDICIICDKKNKYVKKK